MALLGVERYRPKPYNVLHQLARIVGPVSNEYKISSRLLAQFSLRAVSDLVQY